MKMKNTGCRSIRTEAKHEQPDEEDADPQPVRPPRRRQPGVHDVDPGRPRPPRSRGSSAARPGPVAAAEQAEHGREREQHVPAPVDHRLAEPLPAAASSLRSWPNATPPSRDGDRHRRVTPTGTRGPRRARATTVIERHPEERQRAAARVPSHASWRPWTPGGVKSPIRIRTSGRQHPRQVDPAEEHHDEEQRDGDRRRGRGSTARPPRGAARSRTARSCRATNATT